MNSSCAYIPDGIHQYAVMALSQRSVDVLGNLLGKITYAQSLVFLDDSDDSKQVKDALDAFKPLSVCEIVPLDERKKVNNKWKNFNSRVMLTTDSSAHGIDARNVNLICSLDVPRNLQKYMDRIVKAGLCSGDGAAITILTNQEAVANFLRIVKIGQLNVKCLDAKAELPRDLTFNENFHQQCTGFVDSCEKAITGLKADVPRMREAPKNVDINPKADSVPSSEAVTVAKPGVPPAVDTQETVKTVTTDAKVDVGTVAGETQEETSKKDATDVKAGVSAADAEERAKKTVQSSDSGVHTLSSRESLSPLCGTYVFNIPPSNHDWANSARPSRVLQPGEDTITPLAIINPDAMRKYFPDYEFNLEEATAFAIEDRKNNPLTVAVGPHFPQPQRGRGRGGNRGSNFNSGSRGGQSSGGFASTRGSRGGFGQSGSGGFGSNNTGGFGGSNAQTNFGNDQENSSGFNSSRGNFRGRGSFGNHEENSSGFASNRGNFGGRGRGMSQGFGTSGGDSNGFGRGAFSRGGFGQSNSAFNETGSNDIASSRGFASARGSRGAFGQTTQGGGFGGSNAQTGFGNGQENSGGFTSTRGSFGGRGRGNFGQSAGFANNQENSGGFASTRGSFGGRGRGMNQGFGQTGDESQTNSNGFGRGGFGTGGGSGFGQPNAFTQVGNSDASAQVNTRPDVVPTRRFVR